VSTPFNPNGRLILVEARVWGPSGDLLVNLALDTGAHGTLIDPAILTNIGYDPAMAPEQVQITTGSGVEVIPRLRVDHLEALGQTKQQLPILCHTLPPSATVDGLLGLDFLRGQCLTLDFRAGLITLA
jgi:hypothetical protein